MKKIYLTWRNIENQTQEIIRQLHQSNWAPDYVVGITRGGLVPANLISQYLACPMQTLKVSLRDDADCESNCWMPEDAIGYISEDQRRANGGWAYLSKYRKNILIVDDINDSGATLNWIRQDWATSVRGIMPDDQWEHVWNNNVRIATLYDNESSDSELTIDYSAVTINKANEDVWIVFPWEQWWSV